MKTLIRKVSILVIIGLALASQNSFASWNEPLNNFTAFDEVRGVHYAKNTIENPGTTHAIFSILDSPFMLTVAMPFYSTYDDWNINAASRSELDKNLPVIAVKLDQSEVDKLPDSLMTSLGVVDRANVDLFLNVQGLPGVHNDSSHNNTLLQPHMWAHTKVPPAGLISSTLVIYLFKKIGPLKFEMTYLDGSSSIITHDRRLSGNSRLVRELAHPLNRLLTDRIYINSKDDRHNSSSYNVNSFSAEISYSYYHSYAAVGWWI